MNEHIVITGATGVIGVELARILIDRGEKVVLFIRSPEAAAKKIAGAFRYVRWDSGMAGGEWHEYLNGAKALIHLAGKPLFEARWSDEHKKECYDSRVIGTRHLVSAMASASPRPRVFLSSSAIGYYGSFDRCDQTVPLTESSPHGHDFLAKICYDWEKEALLAESLVERLVVLRTGIVLSTRGGMLQTMMPPFQYFAGGPVGSGSQCISWIHIDDEIRAILAVLDNDAYRGAVNLVTSSPVSMKAFADALGAVLGRPSFLAVPEFVVRLMMGDGGEYAVRGQRVRPALLEQHGFSFLHPELRDALRDLVRHAK